jgi:hypothetical protein
MLMVEEALADLFVAVDRRRSATVELGTPRTRRTVLGLPSSCAGS